MSGTTDPPTSGRCCAAPDDLRWVHAASVGVNRLICPELAQRPAVTLTNSRGVFDTSIAEWVLAAVLAHVKGLGETWALQREGRWQYRTTGRLVGTHAAVVGTGSIGRAIADRLARLDVDVTLVGRTSRDDPQFGVIRRSHDLVAIAADVEVLVLAVPLTAATTALVGADVLAALGPTGFLANVGRGPTIVEADLVDALRAGTIAGAALDVFEVEPLPAGSPLWSMPNVLVSPHMSGDYVGFEIDMMTVFTDNLRRWQRGEPLHNIVDRSRGLRAALAGCRSASDDRRSAVFRRRYMPVSIKYRKCRGAHVVVSMIRHLRPNR